MRGLAIIASVLALILGGYGLNTEDQWQEQYALGIRYLSEGNYEEAIFAHRRH